MRKCNAHKTCMRAMSHEQMYKACEKNTHPWRVSKKGIHGLPRRADFARIESREKFGCNRVDFYPNKFQVGLQILQCQIGLQCTQDMHESKVTRTNVQSMCWICEDSRRCAHPNKCVGPTGALLERWNWKIEKVRSSAQIFRISETKKNKASVWTGNLFILGQVIA